MARLKDKVALITGAAGGQGIADAQLLSKEGAAVVLTDVNAEKGEAVAADIRKSGGRALFIKHDVSSEQGWVDVVARTKAEFGRLHILVNNAGTISRKNSVEISLEDWNRVLAVNLTGSLLGIKHCAPLMRDSGGGSIINISSTGGLTAHYDSAYTASKWGLRGLTKSAAVDLAGWNIRVNSIHPGQIADTGFFREGLPGHAAAARQLIPMGRQGTPQECAQLVLFLASDDSSYINATEMVIDGGITGGTPDFIRRKIRDQIAAQSERK